jgi:hypothetical protein
VLSQDSFNNNNNSLHASFQEMPNREKSLVMGTKGIGLTTQMMIESDSSFFRQQQDCLAAKSSSQNDYVSMTVWRTLIVSMSIIFAVAILMYVIVIFIFASEARTTSRPKSDYRDRSEFEAKSDYERCHKDLLSKSSKNGLREILEFYLTDVRIHAFTPVVFFTGLHEAFMARDFVNVSEICINTECIKI